MQDSFAPFSPPICGPYRHLRAARALAAGLLALALTGCALLGQENSSDIYAATAAARNAAPQFDLQVQGPASVRELLLQHLQLQRFRPLPGLRRSELLRLLAQAEEDARQLLATQGHFSPHITITWEPPGDAPAATPPTAHGTPSTEAAPAPFPLGRVDIAVQPGPATVVEQVRITFEEADSADPEGLAHRQSLVQRWGLPVGQTFTQKRWTAAKDAALLHLQSQRYPQATLLHSRADITPAAHDEDAARAVLHLHWRTGAAHYFGPLQWSGSQRYDSVALSRLAQLPLHQPYSRSTLLDAQQRLLNAGYHDMVLLTLADIVARDSVAPDAATTPDEDGPVTAVQVQVHEAPLQKHVLGLGASTDTGFRLSLDHTHNRLPLLGWRAVTHLQVNRKNPLLSTSVMALPGEDGWRWFARGQAQRVELAGMPTDSFSLAAGRSKAQGHIDRVMSVRYEYANLRHSAELASTSATVGYGWVGRYFSPTASPVRGHGMAWEVDAGSSFSPRCQPFVRLHGRWLSLHPLGERVAGVRRSRLALRAQAGAVLANVDAVLPQTLLFFTGGDTTVRGYTWHSIGAQSRHRPYSTHLEGGRYMAAASVEWQRPITIAGNAQDWEHAVFVDTGTVSNRWGDLVLHTGIGTGVRWRSPVGPVQADMAYGLKSRQLRLHLRLGFNF